MGQRGRPKSFDREAVLDAAMLLFWDRGFEQTSVDEVAAAMGICTSSLYSSFGDKEALFLAAVEHYRTGMGSVYDIAVNKGKTAKEGFTNLFELAATEMTRNDQPKGCMLSLALPTCSPEYDELQKELERLRMISETVWVKRLQTAVQSKEIPKSTDVHLLATFFKTTLMGMSFQARAGASQQKLMEIGKLALQVWPGRSSSKS
ncbi:TetR/AcrR family transcriptional regulator [Acidicapsa dinghuensis]|uniref:TetR/AcrR family transcriptional regulator n=1 Tax=Acidicapsa dinghuensis TaxID=2218256 RepID=A0ABW1EGA2_9BACT|nr:TetR/AcrR family transcriptional regulator [Acidicapsa dinghuensis]